VRVQRSVRVLAAEDEESARRRHGAERLVRMERGMESSPPKVGWRFWRLCRAVVRRYLLRVPSVRVLRGLE